MSDISLGTWLTIIAIVANAIAVIAVLQNSLKEIVRRVEKNEGNIQKLFEDTRYIMTGNEIRRILHEQVDPLASDVSEMHDDVLTMKARMKTRDGDDAQTFS